MQIYSSKAYHISLGNVFSVISVMLAYAADKVAGSSLAHRSMVCFVS